MRALVPIADVLIDSHRSACRAERDRERDAQAEGADKPQGNAVVLVNGVRRQVAAPPLARSTRRSMSAVSAPTKPSLLSIASSTSR